ncbi:MAG: hypothetical protein JXP34_09155 [Planctomycetes bacterium]|nr:hypothetical protein [Planctomycetota bacterium]
MVGELFADPARLAGTSLRPAHRGRWIYVNHEEEGGRIVLIRFGILRHPRPLRVSPASHQVVEYYRYEPSSGRIRVERSVRIDRRESGPGGA